MNPNTGRNQLMALPALQNAHANIGYAIASVAGSPSSVRCDDLDGGTQAVGLAGSFCPSKEEISRFAHQVERMSAELDGAARGLAPERLADLGAFRVEVDTGLAVGTASSAGGRIALAASLAATSPTDDIVALLIAREMGHVIARHGEENSGARIASSVFSTIMPIGGFVTRLAVSMLGSQALTTTWAESQRREADELALALLDRTGRSLEVIVLNLKVGLRRDRLAPGEWAVAFTQSTERVNAIARGWSRGLQVASTR